MATVPSSIPGLPPGFVIPNLSGIDLSSHDSIAAAMIRVNATFIGIVASILALRLYVRLVIVRNVGVDDYLMLSAGVSAIAASIMGILGTKHGMGKHIWDLPLNDTVNDTMLIVKYLFVILIMYATGITLAKFSVMASYLRVFPSVTFRRLIYATGAVVLSMWICSVVVTIFQCSPVRGAWDFTLVDTKCISILRFYYVAASFNIATDLLLCILPLPQFWKLKLPLKERLVVCILFGFGFFATGASVARLTQLHNLGQLDVTYSCLTSVNWSIVELGTAILCASVPSTKPLISRLLPGRIFTSHHRPTGLQSVISDPFDLKHLSGIGGSMGLDSRHSRMNLAKTSATVTTVYSTRRGSGEEDSLASMEHEIGMAVSTPRSPTSQRRPSQVKTTHNIEMVMK